MATVTKSLDEMCEVITAQNIASYLGISCRRVYELLDLKPEYGGIKGFRIGVSRRVRKADFIKWLDSQVEK